MNILILHNSYQQRGGEDAVVDAEVKILQDAGHSVRVEIVSNDDLRDVSSKMRTFVNISHDSSRKNWSYNITREHRADIVHVHNFFPILTLSVHEGAALAGAAVIQTIHNYRIFCASATFLRNGNICEKCIKSTNAWAVVHGCYRGSAIGSSAVVRMQNRALKKGGWVNYISRFVALTPFSASKIIDAGLPSEKVVVKPNFVTGIPFSIQENRKGALFVGRLSPEKGLSTLLDAWREVPDQQLTIVGDGPERAALERRALPNVRFVGALPASEVHSWMASAAFLVMPSVWYEGLPVTLLEAYASGLPVIASRIGSLESAVHDGVTGKLFTPGSSASLAGIVNNLTSSELVSMSYAARQEFERQYTAEKNLVHLENIYMDAIKDRESVDLYRSPR